MPALQQGLDAQPAAAPLHIERGIFSGK